ncbi:aspartate aminotransferase family protein [Halobacillus sp. ACCC02827]|uniref:pyridoxal phosphate-dependent decarboxylase family protein n=1 Tax=Halobacillus sp. ACCC02827 TaxID=3052090 RepID=UPI002570939A|nr:aspartate aminotransferase family protein [Halobacillus sp. ACCC02827]WJE17127.1 aspartate aminotransferase family protein [Halobacillus sp. ACCC02827]
MTWWRFSEKRLLLRRRGETMTTACKKMNTGFDHLFLHGEAGLTAFRKQMELVTEAVLDVYEEVDQPFIGKSHQQVRAEIQAMDTDSVNGRALEDVWNELKDPVLKNSLHVSHPQSMAHLHCPPLVTGIAAEVMIGAWNQSMDSWDQSPAATYVEEMLVKYWTDLVRFPEEADGVFTSGGTQSNYMGMLLARDAYCLKRFGHDVQKKGLPENFRKLRVLCSEEAHFSVRKSLAQLGLGEDAVIPVAVNEHHRMDPAALKDTLDEMEQTGLHPFAVAATCGTTDFGSIDPLEEIADICQERGIWFHVDAAYGGGLLFSRAHKGKLAGLERADSVTLDFHKWLYQPISCGLFLLKDGAHMRLLSHHADYLNPKADEEDGILNLVNKSVQTTRRFDALKVLVTLKTVGTEVLGDMVDQTMATARFAADRLAGHPDFLVENAEPEMSAVVFQYKGSGDVDRGALNRQIQQDLFTSGKPIIAKTVVRGETYLKCTILNPRTTEADVKAVIEAVLDAADKRTTGGDSH